MSIKAEKYKKVEIPVPNSTDAYIFSPDGEKKPIAPINVTPISVTYDDRGYETVKRAGEDISVVRFYPSLAGTYVLEYTGEKIEIEVSEGNSRGYASVSEKDPRYIAYSDGTSVPPIGINLAYPSYFMPPTGAEFGNGSDYLYLGLREYERWFSDCSKNGVDLARIWLGQEYFCVDLPEAGECDPVKLALIDRLIDLAEKYGIKLKLTLEQFRYFNYERDAVTDSYSDDVFRKFNKRLWIGDRRCESSDEWLTDPAWQEAWLRKVKMLASHISGNPTVFAIELWNEMNCMPYDSMIKWNEKMLPAVKELFPQHLVINSLGSFDNDWAKKSYDNFVWDKSDMVQLHRYLDYGAKYEICHSSPLDFLPDGIAQIRHEGKPLLVAETGAVNDSHSGPLRYYRSDHDGLIFCDVVYTPLFAGAAGCGNIWHWGYQYVESKNLYYLYRPLYELCKDINFDREKFVCKRVENEKAVLLLLCGENVTLGYLRNKNENWERRLRDCLPCTPACTVLSATLPHKYEVIKIHENEEGSVSLGEGKLCVSDLHFGLLLKFHN